MITKEILRKRLLDTDNFLDNEWLDKYIDLIISNIDTEKVKFKTHRHHILPRYIFKRLHEKEDNTNGNLVNLLFSDHALAHYYLGMASIDRYGVYSNFLSIQHICNLDTKRFEDISEEWLRENLPLLGDLREEALKEQSKQLSIRSKGEHNHFYGKKHTKETREKISKACIAAVTPEKRQKLSEYGKTRDNSKCVAAMAYHNKNFRDYSYEVHGSKISATKKKNGSGNNRVGKIHIEHKDFLKTKYVLPAELDSYIANGWRVYQTQEDLDKLYHKYINNKGWYNLKYLYIYNNRLYSKQQLVLKLNEDGYKVYLKTITKIIKGTTKPFENLIGKIQKVKPTFKFIYPYMQEEFSWLKN